MAVAIRPSGLPVLKKYGSAQAGETARIASNAVKQREGNDIADLHGEGEYEIQNTFPPTGDYIAGDQAEPDLRFLRLAASPISPKPASSMA